MIPFALNELCHLFFPHYCHGCGVGLYDRKLPLCASCLNTLPRTQFAAIPNNPIERIFIGRLNIIAGFSDFYFSKSGLIQALIHQLKYHHNSSIGIFLGNLTGYSLLHSKRFNQFDALIPLPLHTDKMYKRGYNQAEIICTGIAEKTGIPVIKNNVQRIRYTSTQTKKTRIERWENVKDSFVVKNPASLAYKKLILVDDVLTTGATLEACGSVLLKIPGVSLGILTLAYANK